MKESRARQTFKFPDEWQVTKLPEVVWFQEGPGVRKQQFSEHGVKLLNVANIEKNQLNLDKSKNYISNEEAYGKYSHFLINEGELVIASSGIKIENFDEKITFIRKEHLPLCMNTSTIRFRILDKEQIDINYLKWFLRSNMFKRQVQYWVTGSAQLNFGPSHLNKMFIPMLPLEKQYELINALDTADTLRQKRKEQLNLLDDYLKSIFLEMFDDPVRNKKGWNVIKMLDVCSKVTDGTHDTPKRLDSGVKFITGKHIRPFSIDYENSDYVCQSDHEEIYRRCNPEKGDVLYTNIGVNVGTAALNTVDYPFSMKNVALLKLLKEKVAPRYIESLLNYEFVRAEILRKASLGGAQQFLGLQDIKRIDVPLPPIELQNKFASIVEQVEQTKQKMCAPLDEMDNHFNALMQRYFG